MHSRAKPPTSSSSFALPDYYVLHGKTLCSYRTFVHPDIFNSYWIIEVASQPDVNGWGITSAAIESEQKGVKAKLLVI